MGSEKDKVDFRLKLPLFNFVVSFPFIHLLYRSRIVSVKVSVGSTKAHLRFCCARARARRAASGVPLHLIVCRRHHLPMTPALWDLAAPLETTQFQSSTCHNLTDAFVRTSASVHLCLPSRSDRRTIPGWSGREMHFAD